MIEVGDILYYHTARTPPLFSALGTERILYWNSMAISCTTLCLIHYKVYLSVMMGLLRKTSVSRVEGARICPR